MNTAKRVPNPAKIEQRKDVDVKLAQMTQDDRDRQSKAIVQKLLCHPKYKSAKRIALFLSLPTEVDTAPVLADILARGAAPFVPQYMRGRMSMLRVLDGDVDRMPRTSWGIPQHSAADVREDAFENGGLDLVIAPGAAFTATGSRLGHGGGYYDRYLTSLLERHRAQPEEFKRPYILAVAFTQQLYPEVVIDSQDVQVDEVLTAD